jgi:arabinogalactan oligomer/maltooligosaccharide transport system permease protein
MDAVKKGDWRVKASFLISGFGNITRGQFIKGLLLLAIQVLFWVFFFKFGWVYLQDIGTLGTQEMGFGEVDPVTGIRERVLGQNSMLILLYSVVTVFVAVACFATHLVNIKSAYTAQVAVESGKKPSNFIDDLKAMFDKNLHITFIGLPAVGVIAFTVLPIVFMVCIAFTNFDASHQPPGHLFTWTGLDTFKSVFVDDGTKKSQSFFGILGWTLIWAVCATFINYILGIIVSLLINKKGIKCKGLFRTCLVIPIAVPAFVTLMFMSKVLGDQGPANVLLESLGLPAVKFLTTVTPARITVIIVNLWIGIPYTMLITSGILMNIPADLYEAASIDGAGPVKQFTAITLPYMLAVTTPYLITQFIGNINNFNAIFFLTAGAPLTLDYYQAGKTDLLVTWLYKLTVSFQDYNLASVIGILVFIICGALSLATFNITSSAQKEETFG